MVNKKGWKDGWGTGGVFFLLGWIATLGSQGMTCTNHGRCCLLSFVVVAVGSFRAGDLRRLHTLYHTYPFLQMIADGPQEQLTHSADRWRRCIRVTEAGGDGRQQAKLRRGLAASRSSSADCSAHGGRSGSRRREGVLGAGA